MNSCPIEIKNKQTMIDLGIRKIHGHTDPIQRSIRKYTDPLTYLGNQLVQN